MMSCMYCCCSDGHIKSLLYYIDLVNRIVAWFGSRHKHSLSTHQPLIAKRKPCIWKLARAVLLLLQLPVIACLYFGTVLKGMMHASFYKHSLCTYVVILVFSITNESRKLHLWNKTDGLIHVTLTIASDVVTELCSLDWKQVITTLSLYKHSLSPPCSF